MAAKGAEIPVRKPLAQVLEELNTLTAGGTGSFLLVERGYIVNLFHVEKLEDEQIYLDNGSVLPVSRNRLKETREAITRYWRKML
nr:LytTR family DNA-binding domain-containing protein [Enterocloster bolteae]